MDHYKLPNILEKDIMDTRREGKKGTIRMKITVLDIAKKDEKNKRNPNEREDSPNTSFPFFHQFISFKARSSQTEVPT